MEGLIMAAQIILSLSILVGLHEFGHLIAAKAFGMRVERYSIGFPPRIFGKKIGDTDYSIGAIPLGGYVKISGMIDESLDTKNLSEEPEPWEFRAKPAWQRLIVMMGGIIVNVITGIIIFILLVFTYGDEYYSMSEVNRRGIIATDLGKDVGFETGDKIIAINGEAFENFADIQNPNLLLEGGYYTVDRNGAIMDLPIPSDLIEKLSESRGRAAIALPRGEIMIGRVTNGSEAERSGMIKGDKIRGIGDMDIMYNDQFGDFEQYKRDRIGETVPIRLLRGSEEITIYATIPDDGILGFLPDQDIQVSYSTYSFGGSISEGTSRAFSAVFVNAKALWKIVTGQLSFQKSIAGPIAIGTMFGGTWDWERFWSLTGLLSMILAFMNFLPIPALDGGHVMFLGYEIVSGRKPSDKFLEGAQKVGMVILLALMAFIIVNDLLRI